MAFDDSQLIAVLKQLGQADLAILEAQLLPVLESLANSLLPASIEPGAVAVEAAINPAIQSALSALIAKIQL